MDAETWVAIISWGSLILTGLALVASLYLLRQANLDLKVLKASELNGPKLVVGREYRNRELLRSIKLVALGGASLASLVLVGDAGALVRRGLALLVVILITSASFVEYRARQKLLEAVEESVELKVREVTKGEG